MKGDLPNRWGHLRGDFNVDPGPSRDAQRVVIPPRSVRFMFVRWKKRRASNGRLERTWLWEMRQETIDRKGTILSVCLVESYRKDGEPRQRVLKYLGSVGETYLANRVTGAIIDFWSKANKALAELAGQGLSTEEISRVRKNLASKVKPPTRSRNSTR